MVPEKTLLILTVHTTLANGYDTINTQHYIWLFIACIKKTLQTKY